jgi:hypothetical protein
MTPEQFHPANNWILTYLCERPEEKRADGTPLIVLPDSVKAFTNWAEIIAIGPKCKWVEPEHIGCLVVLPDFSADLLSMRPVLGEGYWLVRESAIPMFIYRS